MRVRSWLALALAAVLAAVIVVYVRRQHHLAAADRDSQLLDAVEGGPPGAVVRLLERGADPNARNADGYTALHLAAFIGDTATAKALLNAGADVNASSVPDERGVTPLDIAALHGHENVVECLLEHGASAAGHPNSTTTPLIAATQGGHERVANLLIDRAANPNGLDPVYGRPPIFWAVGYDKPNMLKLLVRRGADVDFRIRSGQTALEYAAYTRRESVANALVAAGATMSLRSAAALGDLEAIKRFLGAGSDVNSQDQQGRTALDYAIAGGHPNVVAALIATGADVNPRGGRQSPLYHAVTEGDVDIARILIEAGADVNASGPLGGTLLDNVLHGRKRPATAARHQEMADLLRQHGAKTLQEMQTGDWPPPAPGDKGDFR